MSLTVHWNCNFAISRHFRHNVSRSSSSCPCYITRSAVFRDLFVEITPLKVLLRFRGKIMCFIFDFFCEHYFYRLRIKRSLALWEKKQERTFKSSIRSLRPEGKKNNKNNKLFSIVTFVKIWWSECSFYVSSIEIRLQKPRIMFEWNLLRWWLDLRRNILRIFQEFKFKWVSWHGISKKEILTGYLQI